MRTGSRFLIRDLPGFDDPRGNIVPLGIDPESVEIRNRPGNLDPQIGSVRTPQRSYGGSL